MDGHGRRARPSELNARSSELQTSRVSDASLDKTEATRDTSTGLVRSRQSIEERFSGAAPTEHSDIRTS
ncbi:hypothetical protein C8Q80DRAFT_441060 [Daedaleopsis nitida]|nr:hypothetical protein C8Q80DRAFT_441060 [Daedaleopsis nitida]